MLPVLAVPVCDGGVPIHLLDDLAPSYTRVVRAKGDLSHLGRVRDDAHLGAAEVVGPQILKPHPGDEQQEPLVLLAVAFVASGEAAAELSAALLVELVEQVGEPESGRCARR